MFSTEEDYGYGPYTVTFPARTTIFILNIPIRDDNILEGNENFTLTINLSSLPDNIFIGDNNQATVIIADDDRKLLSRQYLIALGIDLKMASEIYVFPKPTLG